jgi:glucose-6-phosphate dehydrogenase assembly protein OpcA
MVETLHYPVTIRTVRHGERGERVVAGWVAGPLAVTPVLYEDGSVSEAGYTVTHVATGMTLESRTTGRDLTEEQALELLEKLLAAGLDWEFSRPEDLPAETKAGAVPIIRAFLLEKRIWK